MKFYCDSCGAKYSISDEKVRGKILKVRCKKCAHVITVREARVPTEEIGAAPSAPSTSGGWYYAINGVSRGPMGQDELVAKFASGELGDAIYVWRESFAAWAPARDVDIFARAIEGVDETRGRISTLRVSGALEEIRENAREAPEHEEAGAVPGAASADAPMSARMERLRERLRQEEGPRPIAEPGPVEPEAPRELERPEAAAASFGRAAAERAQVDSDTMLPRFGTIEARDSAIDFSQIETKREDDDASNTFGATQPIIDAPRTDFSEGISNSLLIQFRSIKKQGRGRRAALIAAAVVLVLGLGSTAAVLAARNAGKSTAPVSTLRDEVQKGDLTFNTYSREEIAFSLGEPDEVITALDFDESDGEELLDDELDDETPKKKGRPAAVAAVTRRAAPKKPDKPVAKPAAPVPPRGVSKSGPDLSTGRSRTARGPKASAKKSAAGARTLGSPGTLSQAEAHKGFRRIRRSVASCYQRQMRRGLPLDAPKVFVTVSIQPDGSVTGLTLSPASLKHSEFDSCMTSHQRQKRWKFAAYGGKPLQIKHTYVLQ